MDGIRVIGGKMHSSMWLVLMKQSYTIVVSIHAENTTYIYIYIPQVVIVRLTLHGHRCIHYENVFTSCRRHSQDIPRSPCPRCAVMISRMIDTQPLPHDKDCPQASHVLRGRVWGSHLHAGGNLLSYLFIGYWRFVCNSASAWNCQCITSPEVIFRYHIYIFLREEGSLSCLKLTEGVTPTSTTRLYRGFVNWG
jgi:hypothetical protein